MLKRKVINKRLLISIVALILIPFLLGSFRGKVGVELASAAPDEVSRWYNQMEGAVTGGCKIGSTHVCGDWAFARCGPGPGGADGAVITWGDEPTNWAWGRFTGLDPSITYHGYIEAVSNWWTGDPRNKARIQIERSDGGGWGDYRPWFSINGWQTFDYGTFSGVTSMDLKFRGRTANAPGCADDSDLWVRRVYLTFTPACVWGSTIASPACTQANGLRGEYYRDNPIGGDRFDGGLKMVRNDAVINFDWGAGAPQTPPLCPDNFSIRWTGFVKIPQAGNWTFYTWTDDGAQLWVDGVKIIDKWQDQGPTEYFDTRYYSAGWYPIRFDYYENAFGAVARLSYSGPGVAKQIIPTANLRSCYAPQGPALTCRFTEISSGAIVGRGTAPDPYKIQRGTEWIKIETTASPDPGGGTMDFLVDGGTIASGIPREAGGVWRLTWNGSSTLVVGPHDVNAHFNGFGSWEMSDGYCYFTIVPPANAEYLISARGDISNRTKSFCWGQDSDLFPWKCLLKNYPEGNISGLNTEINAPTYDELLDRFGGGATSFSGSLPTTNGRWRTTGNITVNNPLTFPINRKILIFIDGILTVNAEITVPQSSVVAFIATGIRFRKDLAGGSVITDKADGLYIAEGNIETAYNYAGKEVTHRLVVNGSLISTKGTVVLKRRLSDANSAKYASEQIRLEPKYYVLISQYLGEAQVSWKEVAP